MSDPHRERTIACAARAAVSRSPVRAVDVGRIVHEQEHAQIAGGVDPTLQPRALAWLVGEPGIQQQRVQHDEARGRAHGRGLGEHVTGPGSGEMVAHVR